MIFSRVLIMALVEILTAAMRNHRDDPACVVAEKVQEALGFILVYPLSQEKPTLPSGPKTMLMELKNFDGMLEEYTPELVKRAHPRLIVAIEIVLCVMGEPMSEAKLDLLLRAFGRAPVCLYSRGFTAVPEKQMKDVGEFLAAGGLCGDLEVDLRDSQLFVSVVIPTGGEDSYTTYPIMHLSMTLVGILFFAEEG